MNHGGAGRAITVRAPGKVNLHLGVGPARADGYHDLVNVFQALAIYDHVTVSPAKRLTVSIDASPGIDVRDVPRDHANLAAKAVLALARATGRTAEVAIHIRKDLPVVGGMAGGSADAAAALVACDRLWGTGLGAETLAELGATLGADVPFCLRGGTAVGLGIGEQLTDIPTTGTFHWVLAFATRPLSTPAVYGAWDGSPHHRAGPPPPMPAALSQALAAGDAKALGRALYNDLQPVAVDMFGELAATLRVGDDLGVLGSIVSGTGPTCAFLVESAGHAEAVMTALADAPACASARHATGPAVGPTIVDR